MTDFEYYDENEEDYKSKTQIKREMEALQDLGAKLVKLNPAQRKKVPMSDTMRDALVEADRIKQWSAQRRHLQYIGKVMRTEDADAISARLELFDSTSAANNKRFHQLEGTRDALIGDGGKEILDQYIVANPHVDIQQLRSLVRMAKKEVEQNKTTTSRKKLFKFLREAQDAKLGLL
ncbi:ribosome biogenesis factor YjgA [Marinomonas gallaica]|uniref:ribosome biogenesis factor YjgA n=1 Tax=Marinomonas gallaica TaxID=1806667 RepID=UPI00082E4EAF|nr:ribosome biogenesis factor YjgA [Marinomonas gallaica]